LKTDATGAATPAFLRFFAHESAGGIVLALAAALALVVSNSAWQPAYQAESKIYAAHLLETKPNAKIATGYDTIVLTLKSGGAAAGIVAAETPATISLRTTDNQLVEVKKDNIAKRDSAPSGMPEIYGAILTKSEIRNVVEYLASLRTRGEARPDDAKPRALRHLTAE
jgi:putative heme-binding domain-containing protein